MFRPFTPFLLLSLCYSLSIESLAGHPLCVTSVNSDAEIEEQQEPTPDEYRSAMDASVKSAIENLDWVDDTNSDSLCDGYYQAPINPNPEKHIDAKDAHTKISAGNLAKDADGFTTMNQDVEFFQGSRSFRCDSLRYSEEQEYTELNGNIVLREKDILVIADSASIDGKNQRSDFNNTRFLIADSHLRGQADSIQGQSGEQEQLNLTEASFTLCPPNQESWSIAASEIDLDIDQGWGKAKHTVLKIKDVPVFYFPYFDFPIDDRRKSGFLWPSISGGSEGIDLTLPYYFNLAPNYDLTYQARYLHEHGYQHGIETRYKNTISEWQLGGSYINDDKKIGDIETGEDDSIDSERWLGFVKESGVLHKNWSSYIDYTAVSDVEYFRDWGTKGLDVKKSLHIERSAGLNFQTDNWFVNSQVLDYQSLELDSITGDTVDNKYQLLPQINAEFTASQKPFSIKPVFFSQYSYFTHDTMAEAQRLYSEVGATLPLGNQFFLTDIKVSAKTLNYRYDSDNELTDVNNNGEQLIGSDSLAAGTATIDSKLFFQRSINISNSNLTQTLTPRLFYYYAENKDQTDLISFDTSYTAFNYQQVFREERFAGFDRISDANQLSLGFDSQIFSDISGMQSFHFGIGQIFYFDDRDVALNESDKTEMVISPSDDSNTIKQKENYNRFIEKQFYRGSSDIASEINWQYSQQHGIYSDVIYDPYNNNIAAAGVAYHFENNRQQTVNLSYRYSKDNINLNNQSYFNDVEQAGLSFYSPISTRWALFANSSYDIEKNERIENLVGFKYGSCCWSVLFAWQEERQNFSNGSRLDNTSAAEYDRNWYIQFELTGLGSVSKSITRLLEESIEGFNHRDRFN